jgi:hypothetical protein
MVLSSLFIYPSPSSGVSGASGLSKPNGSIFGSLSNAAHSSITAIVKLENSTHRSLKGLSTKASPREHEGRTKVVCEGYGELFQLPAKINSSISQPLQVKETQNRFAASFRQSSYLGQRVLRGGGRSKASSSVRVR